MRAIVYTGAGGAEVMRLEERPDPRPGSDEVLVEAAYSGLNPADVNQRAGNYPAPPGSPPDVPGLEVSGTVAEVGENVHDWRPGDRVFGLVGGGGLADRVRVNVRHVARVPDSLDDRTAAAVPEAFITAHDAVFTQAGLRPGERLLVNGANGAVGLAAVQTALATGARVLANVRSQAAGERLLAMGARTVALEDARDVDVVLELVGAPNIEGDLAALASQGRIVVVSTAAGSRVELSLGALMGRRATMIGTLLRARPLEQKAAAVQAFARQVVPLLESGAIVPVVDRVFPAEQAAEALDHLQQPGKFGKVLLAW
ncbi:MAG TPA: zinc-binding dehydrogenase [Gaiellales bacterium]|nr:zinc-binding dehydrogenase [Gaiellales bacterium]